MIDLTGKVLLVTGASRGIGAACARTAVKAGADVVVHGLHDRPVRAIADELGSHCHPIVSDLADPGTVALLWEEAVAWRRRLDVLINDAGVYEPASVDGDDDDWMRSWARTMAINLLSPTLLCREAIRTFRRHGGGTILNVASRAAFRGDDADYMHYAASKAGIVAVTKTIARAHGRDGIVAVAIAPGFVRTELNRALSDRSGVEAAADETALGEIAEPQDIANTILFLASGLARHVTGAMIDINGASYVR